MHPKDIKLIIRKQLKKQFPNWKRLSRKEKKEIDIFRHRNFFDLLFYNLKLRCYVVRTQGG